jgi:hypothetical protein
MSAVKSHFYRNQLIAHAARASQQTAGSTLKMVQACLYEFAATPPRTLSVNLTQYRGA